MLFTHPDGTPCQRRCLFGVQLGLTLYKQAVEPLRNHPFTRTFQSEGMRNMFSNESLSVILSLDANDRVSGVTLISYSNSSPLARLGSVGDMLALLGAPNTVERDVGYLQSNYLEDHLLFFISSHLATTLLSMSHAGKSVSIWRRPASHLLQVLMNLWSMQCPGMTSGKSIASGSKGGLDRSTAILTGSSANWLM